MCRNNAKNDKYENGKIGGSRSPIVERKSEIGEIQKFIDLDIEGSRN